MMLENNTQFKLSYFLYKAFPCSSAGKKSACNAGDPGSIPRSGRSTGEGIGYPLQYSWASLWLSFPGKKSACNVGDLDAIPELGRSHGEGILHSSILAWRIPCTVYPWGLQRAGHDSPSLSKLSPSLSKLSYKFLQLC